MNDYYISAVINSHFIKAYTGISINEHDLLISGFDKENRIFYGNDFFPPLFKFTNRMITYDEFLESYRHRAKKYAVRFSKRKTVDRKPSYSEFENIFALVLSDLLRGKYPVSNPYYPLAYEVKENGDSGFVDVNRVWVGLDVYDGLEENLHDIKTLFSEKCSLGNYGGKSMKIVINADGVWYHGSNMIFSELRTNSTITQWKELAEAFSHQPSILGYDDNGVINHNGVEKGYLYIIDEPVDIQNDIFQHPRTTMDENAEFLTKRPLKVKMISEL